MSNSTTTTTTSLPLLMGNNDNNNNNNNRSSSLNLSDILSDEVSQTKLLASLILFVITLLCGYLPIKILLNQNYIQYAMFAGGGVLMATAFCHLIPEAHDNFKSIRGEYLSTKQNNQHHHHNHNHNHMAAAASDLINSVLPNTPSNGVTLFNNNNLTTVLVNNSITSSPFNNSTADLDYDNNLTSDQNLLQLSAAAAAAASDNNSISSYNNNNDSFFTLASNINVPYLEITLCCGFFFMYFIEQLMVRFINNHSHNHAPQTACDSSLGQLVVPISCEPIERNNQHQHQHQNSTTAPGGAGDLPNAANGCETNFNLSIVDSEEVGTSNVLTNNNNNNNSRGGAGGGGDSSSSNLAIGGGRGQEFYKFMRGLLIVSAFGAHSIFDGVAIGSQHTTEKVWTIFLAISCHKLIIAAVVGLELYSATLESNLWTLVHLTIFSIMSPIGILLVVIAQESLHIDGNHPAMILLQSFATGTLLYIVFVEILQPKEDQIYEKNKFGKSLSLIAGFALMVVVLTVMDE